MNSGNSSGVYYDDDGLRVDPSHGGDGGPLLTDTPLDDGMQDQANAPAADPTGLDDDVQEFLETTMNLVYDGKVDVYKPSSLLNEPEYNKLGHEAQGLADQTAMVFCGKMREIKALMDISGGERSYAEPTYQIQHLVKELKFHKEQFENEHGDVFVI